MVLLKSTCTLILPLVNQHHYAVFTSIFFNSQLYFAACKRAIDLGIVMDASGSVGYSNYKKVRKFLVELSEYFTISASGTHFGVIHYSYSGHLDFTPRSSMYWNRETLKAKLKKIVYSRGKDITRRNICIVYLKNGVVIGCILKFEIASMS